jgi:hypothetical protein
LVLHVWCVRLPLHDVFDVKASFLEGLYDGGGLKEKEIHGIRMAQQLVWPKSLVSDVKRKQKKYVDASEQADLAAFTSIIRDDAIFRMPPQPGIVVGRDAMLKLWVDGGFGSEGFGRLRCVLTRANLQPAVASYVRRPGDTEWRAMSLDVLRIEEGVVAEIVTFPGDLFPRFGFPRTMDAQTREDRLQ